MSTQLPFKAVQLLGKRGNLVRGLPRSPQREGNEAGGGVEGAVLAQLMRCLHLRSPSRPPRSTSEPAVPGYTLQRPLRSPLFTAKKPSLGDIQFQDLQDRSRKISRIMRRAKEMNVEAERIRRIISRKKNRPREFRTFLEPKCEPSSRQALPCFRKPMSQDFNSYRDRFYDMFSKSLNQTNKPRTPSENKIRSRSTFPCLYSYLSAKGNSEKRADIQNKYNFFLFQNISPVSKSAQSTNTSTSHQEKSISFPMAITKKLSLPLNRTKSTDVNPINYSTFFSNRNKESPKPEKSVLNHSNNEKLIMKKNQSYFGKIQKVTINKPETLLASRNVHQSLKKDSKIIKRYSKKNQNFYERKPFFCKLALKELTRPPGKKTAYANPPKHPVEQNRSYNPQKPTQGSAALKSDVFTAEDTPSRTAYDPSSSHRNVFDRFFQKLHGNGPWLEETPGKRQVYQRCVSFTDTYAPPREQFLKNKPRSPFHKSPDRTHGIRCPHSPSCTGAKGTKSKERFSLAGWVSAEGLSGVRQSVRNISSKSSRLATYRHSCL